MGAALDRAGRDAEQRGDLGDGTVFDVHEAQHVAFHAGKTSKGGCDLGADQGGLGEVQAGLRISGSDSATGSRRRTKSAAWLRAITHIQARGVPCGR